MKPDEHLDFPDLIRRLLDAGETVCAYRSDCYWLDIGRHDDYEQALEEFERMRDRLIPEEAALERRSGAERRDDPPPTGGSGVRSISETSLLRRVEP
jgi:NDP-sugar pyrophosphorylase family protein